MTNTGHPESADLPRSGRLLGIDFGSVRIGLSICDSDQTIAGPLATRIRQSPEADAKYFRELIAQENIVGIVLGMPLHLSGRESEKSRAVQAFATWLKSLTDRPIAFYDERFSTATADELIGGELTRKQRKARIDKIAAQIILKDYLESNRKSSSWQQEIE